MGEKKDYLRKEQFRRYRARPFRNPYFQAPRRERRQIKQYAVVAGALVMIVGLIYLFGFASFWNLREVRVLGLQFMSGADIVKAADEEMAGRRYLIFPERNRLFFNPDHLKEVLSEKFSFAELKVDVERGTVVIEVKERVSQVLWMTNNVAYFVDVFGTIIRALPAEDVVFLVWHGSNQPRVNGQVIEGPYPRLAYLTSLPLIVVEDDAEAVPGGSVLTERGVAGIIAMAGRLENSGLTVKQFIVERRDSVWAKALVTEGFDVLFDTAGDIESQVGYLMTVLDKNVPDRALLDYVDVRFGDHVYFKLK
ncbi:MAG: hypothetical protein AAB429_00335 [Patescibacteria group bacterium]